jgi:hypothetical protein
VEAIWTATEIFWTEKLIHVRAAHVVRSYSLEFICVTDVNLHLQPV